MTREQYRHAHSLMRWCRRLYDEDRKRALRDLLLYGEGVFRVTEDDFDRRAAAFPWRAPKMYRNVGRTAA